MYRTLELLQQFDDLILEVEEYYDTFQYHARIESKLYNKLWEQIDFITMQIKGMD
jgi:hypothetical protein